MQDAVMKGTGDSRYLKSVGGFLALYPTYEAFADALVRGELPIDLNGVNEEGWAQLGTPLDKASLLTDSTAALVGLGDEATPNDMFAALAEKAKEAQNTASSAASAASAASNKAGSLIRYGTSDLTAGSSTLATGTIYLVYK